MEKIDNSDNHSTCPESSKKQFGKDDTNSRIVHNPEQKTLESARVENSSQYEKPKYILLEKTKALYTLLHPLLMLFPSNARFTLGARIEENIISAIEFLVMQNYQTTDDERGKMVLGFMSKMNILGILVQQAIIFRYISFEKGEQVNSLTREIQSIASSRYSHLTVK